MAIMMAAVTGVLSSCGGSDSSGGRSEATDAESPGTTATTAPTSTTKPVAHAAPRWETVTTLKGSGATTTAPFDILAGAIQWRVRWDCQAGHLKVTSDPPPRKGRPLVDGACPGKGDGYAIHTGSIRLAVEATGAWTVVVDQQIDTPLDEPPLQGTGPQTLVGEGQFIPVEMKGKGVARLHALPDGTRVVRFEDAFEVSTNTDLFVWLSEAESPRTSREALDSPHVVIGNLKSTLGSQNYVVPAELPTDKVRSIVIWCEPVAIAYAAAPLTRS